MCLVNTKRSNAVPNKQNKVYQVNKDMLYTSEIYNIHNAQTQLFDLSSVAMLAVDRWAFLNTTLMFSQLLLVNTTACAGV